MDQIGLEVTASMADLCDPATKHQTLWHHYQSQSKVCSYQYKPEST